MIRDINHIPTVRVELGIITEVDWIIKPLCVEGAIFTRFMLADIQRKVHGGIVRFYGTTIDGDDFDIMVEPQKRDS